MRIERPRTLSADDLRIFERLVREGFRGSDDSLPDRIRAARRLAFHYSGDVAVGIAGLKAPDGKYRREVFRKAGVSADPDAYVVELGWVYVTPGQRGRGLGGRLCRRLLEHVSGEPVFATTRPGNDAMIRILETLGFARFGKPYPRREEEHALFLRPDPTG